jgi:hypothetical protein
MGLRWVASSFVLAAISAGCIASRSPTNGTGGPSRPTVVFPQQGELAKLPSLPAPADAFTLDAAPVDHWSLPASATRPDVAPGGDDTSPLGEFSRGIVSAHKDAVRFSPALRCAAAEVARFYVAQRALPTESLRRFMVARCGGTSPGTLPVVYGGDARAQMTDAMLLDQAKDAMRRAVEAHLSMASHQVLGFATHREGGRFAVAAVIGTDEVDLEPAPRTADGSRRVVVRGNLRAPAADVTALINRGDYSAEHCLRDGRVQLPAFAVSCRLDDADKTAWMQILVRREGRVMEDPIADLLVSEGDATPIEYHARSLGPPAAVADAEGFVSTLLGAINRIRTQGKLAPLSPATKQAKQNARLAGTLIDASVKGRSGDIDGITLGLLAGWDVDGLIRNGDLLMAVVAPTRDAMAWLDFALERPLGRTVLLDPDARRIAIGPALPGGGAPALGAVVTTFALFESASHERDIANVVARVTNARKELGRPAFAQLGAERELAGQAQLVLAGQREPYEALNVAMQAVVDRVRGRIAGFYVESNDLESAPIPDTILRAGGGALAVYVTHHRVKGAAWGQFVVFYLLTQDAERGGRSVDL